MRKFQRIFTDNVHYGSFEKFPYMDSLAYVTQEFLYSDVVEGEWYNFSMNERIKLYDFMTLVVHIIDPSVAEFGKATIKGYIEDLKVRKYNYQNEDNVTYTDDGYLLVTDASFELIDSLLWVAYIYAKTRSEFSDNESWANASEMLFTLAWKESGFKREAFNKLSLIESTNKAIETFQKHIAVNAPKHASMGKMPTSRTESKEELKNNKDMKKMAKTNKVFIVHGHNEAIKEKVARVLTKLQLEPVILHEQADGGRTLIEKFEANSEEVNYAIVLLTGDDEGKSIKSNNYKHRARQNVIFEMGYFMGHLSRSHVFLLLEEGVEKPSDLEGIVYTSLNDNWQHKLVKELKACGYEVDANKLL